MYYYARGEYKMKTQDGVKYTKEISKKLRDEASLIERVMPMADEEVARVAISAGLDINKLSVIREPGNRFYLNTAAAAEQLLDGQSSQVVALAAYQYDQDIRNGRIIGISYAVPKGKGYEIDVRFLMTKGFDSYLFLNGRWGKVVR